MKNSFKILFSFLSFFFFGIAEGLAFVEISENKNEALDEVEADLSSNFIADTLVKYFFNETNQEKNYLELAQEATSVNVVISNFSSSYLAVKKSFDCAKSKESSNKETKLYLLFHRMIYYI